MTASTNPLSGIDFSKLGSQTALSFISTNALPITLIAAAGVTTIVAFVAAYRAYEKYEEKKHLEDINWINSLHKTYLEKIDIPQFKEVQGFPPIYKFIKDKDVNSVQSLHLNDDEIKMLGSTRPESCDISLSHYHELILDAILELKIYYFSRSDRNDTTAGVLSYLMYMINEKCLTFEGYDFDIAYLDALQMFVNAYMSEKERENTQHFSHLQYVCSYLRQAKQELEKHKNRRTLFDLSTDLRNTNIKQSRALILKLVQLLTRQDYWKYINTIEMDELAKGVIRKEYIHTELGGIGTKDKEISISDAGYFEDWIKKLASFYMESLSIETKISAEDIRSPEDIFLLPNVERLAQLTKDEEKALSNKLDEMRKVFKICNNFITERYSSKSKKFIPASENEILIARSGLIKSFAELTHEIISLQLLSTYILKSIQELGEIAFKNPQHFHAVFKVLYGLCGRIKESSQAIKKEFVDIQTSNNNHVQIIEKEALAADVQKLLATTETTISKLIDRIKNYRDNLKKDKRTSKQKRDEVKHGLFAIVEMFSKIFNIPVQVAKQSTADAPPARRKKSKKVLKSKPDVTTVSTPDVIPAMLEAVATTIAPSEEIHSVESIAKIKEVEPVSLIEQINTTIAELSKQDVDADTKEKELYYHLRDQLVVMQEKSKKLKDEVNKSIERTEKAEGVYNLTTKLCQQTLTFLKQNKSDRDSGAKEFVHAIRSELSDQANSALIDKHNRPISKALSVIPFSVFHTETRKDLTKLLDACDDIQALASRRI